MKKLFLFAAALAVTLSVSAGKKVVISVGDFETTVATDFDIAELVRSNVTSGLSNVSHLQLIDTKDGLGADFLITGKVVSFDVTRTTNDQGEVYYKTTMIYTITSTNMKENTNESETFNYTGNGLANMKFGYSQDPNTSKQAVFAYIADDMKRFAINNYPLVGQIVEADYVVDKKGKLTECYITLGSEDGVDSKTKFEVFLGKVVAGRTTSQRADVSLTVLEVVAGDLARCKVSGKEADKVAAAVEAYASDPKNALPVQVKMKPKKDFGGWDKIF